MFYCFQQPETRRSPSISPLEENEPVRRRPYIPKPVDRSGGDRLSPDSLQRKLTAEINLLENVEDSVRQVSDIERTRSISLAQQETVSLAQILKVNKTMCLLCDKYVTIMSDYQTPAFLHVLRFPPLVTLDQ